MLGTAGWIGAGILVVGLALAWWRRSRRGSGGWGFYDLIRDPERRDSVLGGAGSAFAFSEHLARQDPHDVVTLLLKDETYGDALRALGMIDEAAVPALVDALSNPAFRVKIPPSVQERQHFLYQREEPIEGVLNCLMDHPVPEVLPPLLAMTDMGKRVASSRARLAAATGRVASLPIVLEALQGDATKAVLQGILSIKPGTAEPAFCEALFSPIAALLTDPKGPVEEAARCLLGLNRTAAIEMMLGEGRLEGEARDVLPILRALVVAKVEVPPGRLRSVFDAHADSPRYWANKARSSVVQLAGYSRDPQAEELLDVADSSDDASIRIAAVEARLDRAGVESPWDLIHEHMDRSPIAARCDAVAQLYGEVANGGLSQYFFNSHADSWKLALEGLDAMGATEHAARFRRAVALFGESGPSESRSTRHDQLSEVMGEEDPFSAFDEDFATDELLRHVFQYLLDNLGALNEASP